MDTFSDLSETTFAAPKPYDPAADRTLVERLSSGSGWSEAYDASRESGRAIESWRSREVGRADWFGEAADRVHAATGVRLPNPYFAPEAASSSPTGLANASADPFAGKTRADLEKDFFARVGELVPAHPDLADIDAEFVDLAVAGRAQRAERTAAQVGAVAGVNPLLRFAGSMAGGFVGKASTMDPGTLVGLALPVGGAGETLLARVASAALTQGAEAAAVTAAEQPTVQGWRADVGLSHGVGPALENIGEAALFGAAGGVVFQGLGEAAGAAFKRLLGGRVAPEEIPAVVAAARKEGAFVSDETEAAMRAAAAHDQAAATMMAERPETVPEHAAASQLADAAAMAEEPTRPPPLVDRPIPVGTTDDLARRLTDPAASPWEALDGLRQWEADAIAKGAPSAIDSALSSTDPFLRDLGRIALLDPDIADRVLKGEFSLDHAALVAATTGDAARQAAALTAIGEAKPRTNAEARVIAADAVAAETAHASAAAMHGTELLDRLPPPARPSAPAPADSRDIRHAVPLVREDGTVEIVSREALGRVAEREKWMGDVIAACKV